MQSARGLCGLISREVVASEEPIVHGSEAGPLRAHPAPRSSTLASRWTGSWPGPGGHPGTQLAAGSRGRPLPRLGARELGHRGSSAPSMWGFPWCQPGGLGPTVTHERRQEWRVLASLFEPPPTRARHRFVDNGPGSVSGHKKQPQLRHQQFTHTSGSPS